MAIRALLAAAGPVGAVALEAVVNRHAPNAASTPAVVVKGAADVVKRLAPTVADTPVDAVNAVAVAVEVRGAVREGL